LVCSETQTLAEVIIVMWSGCVHNVNSPNGNISLSACKYV